MRSPVWRIAVVNILIIALLNLMAVEVTSLAASFYPEREQRVQAQAEPVTVTLSVVATYWAGCMAFETVTALLFTRPLMVDHELTDVFVGKLTVGAATCVPVGLLGKIGLSITKIEIIKKAAKNLVGDALIDFFVPDKIFAIIGGGVKEAINAGKEFVNYLVSPIVSIFRDNSDLSEPLDVYFLVDLSGSFANDLSTFKDRAPDIINSLKSENPDIRVGIGSFEDYPIFPFGSAAAGDKAYEQLVDLTPDTDTVLSTIQGLFTRYGMDRPESQLPALYQTATGEGQDLSGVGYPGASISPGQQANFRDNAVKQIILWTDAPFHQPNDPGDIPYPGPSFSQTIRALTTVDPPKFLGISSGTSAVSDLERIATGTNSFAPSGGLDCDGDGIPEVPEGAPMVCTIATAAPTGIKVRAAQLGGGIAAAILALVEAAIQAAIEDVVEEALAGFVYSDLEVSPTKVGAGQKVRTKADVINLSDEAGTETVNLLVDGVIRDSQELTLDPGESQVVEFIFTFSKGEIGDHEVTINGLDPITVAVVTEGDINADGSIDATDVRWLVEAIMGLRELTPEQRERADVAPPPGLDSTDARYIVEFIQGIRSTLAAAGTLAEAQARSSLQQVQGAQIEIESKQDIIHGETTTLQLSIRGLSSPGLADLQIGPQGAIRFDPKVIQVKSVKGIGPFQVMHPLLIDNENGEVRFIAVASSKKFVKEGPIIELAVTAVGREGEISPIEITGFDALRDGEIRDIQAKIINGRVTLGEAQELQVNSVLNIPNPVTGRSVEFRVEGLGIKTVQVEIVDLSGQRIFNSGEVFGQTLQWNLQNDSGNIVANGVYLYLVTVRGFNEEVYRSTVKKLVVLR